MDHNKLWKIFKGMGIPGPLYLSPKKPICGLRRKSLGGGAKMAEDRMGRPLSPQQIHQKII